MEKLCTRCKNVKAVSEFYRSGASRPGYYNQCKSCKGEVQKAYREANKEKTKEAKKVYYQVNKDKIRQTQKAYCEANKDKIKEAKKAYHEANKEKRRAYYEANKDKIKEAKKAYYQANKDKIKEAKKAYYEANKDKINTRHAIYCSTRRKTDELFAMRRGLGTRMRMALTAKGFKKKSKTADMLGCDIHTFKRHIEKQFTKGMSWNNRSEWHLDHIVPCASANTEDELIKLFHYTNIQPLWAKENMSKGDSMPHGHQPQLKL